MNFRSSSAFPETTPSTNLQRDSYAYGYGGGRTDLPAVGYNPVYPVGGSTAPAPSQNFSTSYTQANPYTYQQYSHQGTSTSSTFASPYAQQEYNPDYPGYDSHYSLGKRDAPATSIITVDRSRYSVKNTLYNNFAAPNTFTSVAGAPPQYTLGFGSNNASHTVLKKAPTPQKRRSTEVSGPAPTQPQVSSKPPLIEIPDEDNNTADKSQKAILPAEPNKTVMPANNKKQQKQTPKYQETLYDSRKGWGSNPWHYQPQGDSFGASPWHHQPQAQWGSSPWKHNQATPPRPFRGPPNPGYYPTGSPARPVRPVRQPYNNKDDIPFEPIPEGTETLTFKIDPENIECFNGPTSIFTTQHVYPILIGNSIYESIDHYYQYRKLMDLCGSASEKITGPIRDRHGIRQDGKKEFNEKRGQAFSQIAREQLKLNSVGKDKTEEWRRTKGLKAVQDGLLAKAQQNHELRLALLKSGTKILVHSYAADTIYGSGAQAPEVKKWSGQMVKSGCANLTIPSSFPLNEQTVKHCPTVSRGRNILGVILMQLREMIVNGTVTVVDIKILLDAIKEGKDPEQALLEDLSFGGGDFSIGGGTVQQMDTSSV